MEELKKDESIINEDIKEVKIKTPLPRKTCECGMSITKSNYATHLKGSRHAKNILIKNQLLANNYLDKIRQEIMNKTENEVKQYLESIELKAYFDSIQLKN